MRKLVLLLLLLSVSLAVAQTMETPVSFDSQGKIMEWDRKKEVKACLFPEIPDFNKALLWSSDNLYTLEIFSAKGRTRRALTQADFDSLRFRVNAFLVGGGKQYVLDQEGRGAYLLWQIPLSLGWYGPAVLMLTEPKNGTTATGLYLTSAAATYFVPFLLTKNRQITSGQEHLSVAYGFRGIAAGGFLTTLLGTEDKQAYASIMLATSISGQIAGYHYGYHFTKPQGRIISHYANFGMADLPLLVYMFQKEPDEKTLAAAGLAGLTSGTYLGYRLAQGAAVSDGEPTIVATSGWMGMAAGAGFYLSALSTGDSTDVDVKLRLFTACCLGGNAAGLYFGHKYTRGYSYSRGDGFIVAGTTAGGALLGGGIGFLISPREGKELTRVRVFTGAATIGMLGGYALGIKTVRNQESKRLGRLDINLDNVPLGLALAASKTPAKVSWISATF